MFSKPNTQAIKFADVQATQARLRGDVQSSNLYWAIKVLLQCGRPEIQDALNKLPFSDFHVLVRAQYGQGTDVGTAWWAIRHCVEQQKERAYAQQERAVAFRNRRQDGARVLV